MLHKFKRLASFSDFVASQSIDELATRHSQSSPVFCKSTAANSQTQTQAQAHSIKCGMNCSSSSNTEKSKKLRGKSQGWASFDRKQRQKQGALPPEDGEDPYPPMLLHPRGNQPRNNGFHTRPFSSVLLPIADFPALTDNVDTPLLGKSGVSNLNEGPRENNRESASSKLKELHSWADYSLIEDILATVDRDVDKASFLLKSMVSHAESKENNPTQCSTICNDFQQDTRAEERLLPEDGTTLVSGLAAEIADLGNTLEDALKDNVSAFSDIDASSGKRFSDDDDDDAHMKLILGLLRSVPVEPEWEQDDVYLVHRKDALRVMRSASQHSRAATNAFLRGDHFSARQYSKKACDGWAAAKLLNDIAAKEILNMRNSNTDPWKLDLHGLHAGEAIQALQDHLLKIENQIPLDWPTSLKSVVRVNEIEQSSLGRSFSSLEVESLDRKQAAFRQRPASLQIITGVGNHSRGGSALPSAVRSYLSEKRYRFDETRPGVISVRPKFRHR